MNQNFSRGERGSLVSVSFGANSAVTVGALGPVVQIKGQYGLPHSVVMRAKSGTVRFIEGRHSIARKPNGLIG